MAANGASVGAETSGHVLFADGLPTTRIEVGGLSIDAEARTLHVDGSLTEVTRTEFDLLAVMASRPRAALTRRQLIEAVWGPGWFGDEHVVDVHIGHLRTKLGDDHGPLQPRDLHHGRH
jgi:DNA-binding response OmpR family regulator